MNPGELKHKVIIQRQVDEEDEKDISHCTWIDLKTVWCAINNLYGREYWTAKQYKAENTVQFIIRYGACNDLSAKDRISWNGKLFNISSIDNVKYENKFIKIRAMEVI